MFIILCDRALCEQCYAELRRGQRREIEDFRVKAPWRSDDVSSKAFTVPAALEKITACEAWVYGRGPHAPWCQEGLVLDPTGPTSPITPQIHIASTILGLDAGSRLIPYGPKTGSY
jgi:hypothetical protein